MKCRYVFPILAAIAGLLACGEMTSPETNPQVGVQVSKVPSSSDFALIPAGTFMMGDPSGQDGHAKPAHQVTISRPFLMQKTHVTVGQFKAFVSETAYRTEAEEGDGAYVWVGYWTQESNVNWRYPNFSQNDQYPVVCVTWKDAQAFITWMNQKDPGKGYRLPTEENGNTHAGLAPPVIAMGI